MYFLAVHRDPDFRPKITKMFEVLNNCLEDYLKGHSQDSPSFSSSALSRKSKPTPKQTYSIDQDVHAPPSNIPDFVSFKYMTLTDAAKQHKMINRQGELIGDVKTAYKCFEAYANLGGTGTANHNQIKAKYYKACYISRGFVESLPNKDKIVAELFKEVADDEAVGYHHLI
jgi:hypothetical protein